MPTLPKWLESADPARYAAEGLRIGDSETAERNAVAEHAAASSRAEEQLRLRQQQLEAQSTAAAQKYQAQQGYQQALAQGVDPIHAILKFGPMMGRGDAVGAALRVQQAASKPQPAAPVIQMMAGPDGKQIPVLVQGGHASVVPRTAYTPPPPQEQFKPAVRNINGRDVPGQESSKSGKFIPYPAGEQAGAVTPQQRLQMAAAQRKKTALEKTLGDELQLLTLAKKRAGGKTPTHADLEAVETELRQQTDDLDGQISQLAGGVSNVPQRTSNGRVSIIDPDGKRGTIPADQLDEALSAGYKQTK